MRTIDLGVTNIKSITVDGITYINTAYVEV